MNNKQESKIILFCLGLLILLYWLTTSNDSQQEENNISPEIKAVGKMPEKAGQ